MTGSWHLVAMLLSNLILNSQCNSSKTYLTYFFIVVLNGLKWYFACVSSMSVFACPFTSSPTRAPTRANHNSLIMTVNFHTAHSGSAMRNLRVWTQTYAMAPDKPGRDAEEFSGAKWSPKGVEQCAWVSADWRMCLKRTFIFDPDGPLHFPGLMKIILCLAGGWERGVCDTAVMICGGGVWPCLVYKSKNDAVVCR